MNTPTFLQHPYVKINLIFAGIILGIFVYSGIFSAQKSNHPIPSGYKLVTGENTQSTGLSRAFSEIVRLRFNQARSYNPESIRVFSFFLVQFLLRGLFSLWYVKKTQKWIILTDSIFSTFLFLWLFRNFFLFWG